MGYCIHQSEAKFTIPAEKVQPALEMILAEGKGSYPSPREIVEKGRDRHGRDITIKNYKFLPPVLRLGQLCESAYGFMLESSDEASITGIEWQWEKSHNEDDMFMVLGPFVDAGCFVEMTGEDGSCWRFMFDGQKCVRKDAKMVWGSSPPQEQLDALFEEWFAIRHKRLTKADRENPAFHNLCLLAFQAGIEAGKKFSG